MPKMLRWTAFDRPDFVDCGGERRFREAGAGGSNPLTPTSNRKSLRAIRTAAEGSSEPGALR